MAGLGGGFSAYSPRVGMAQDLSAAGAELPELMTAGRGRTAPACRPGTPRPVRRQGGGGQISPGRPAEMNLKLHRPADFALRTRWVLTAGRNPWDRAAPVFQLSTIEGTNHTPER